MVAADCEVDQRCYKMEMPYRSWVRGILYDAQALWTQCLYSIAGLVLHILLPCLQ